MLCFSKVKIKVDSLAVIKPFAARFANSKKIYILPAPLPPPPVAHAPIPTTLLSPSTAARPKWKTHLNGCRRKTNNMNCAPRAPRTTTSQNSSHNPLSPLPFHVSEVDGSATVPGGCRIRRKITRAYLGLSQARAINAHCAVTVKNEVAVQGAEQGVGQGDRHGDGRGRK